MRRRVITAALAASLVLTGCPEETPDLEEPPPETPEVEPEAPDPADAEVEVDPDVLEEE